jgi:hypothetical protein
MADPKKALPELQRRLESQLSVRDGVAFITTYPFIETTAVSRNSAWRVKCGMLGLSVSMPYGSNEDEADLLLLTSSTLNEGRCKELVPAIAKRVQTILEGQP